MITKSQAIEIMKSYWQPPSMSMESLGFYPEDGFTLDSKEPEILEIMEWAKGYLAERYALAPTYEQEWTEPEETPCGWIFDRKLATVGGASWYLVDLWTGERISAGDIRGELHPIYPPQEAMLRLYIDDLPTARREDALRRMDLLPYEPVRFYPPYLSFKTSPREASETHSLIVEFDSLFFSERQLSLPKVILQKIQYGKDHYDLKFADCPDMLRKTKEWKEKEMIYHKFQIVLPADELRRGVRLVLKISEFPPEETVYVESIKDSYFPMPRFALP